MAELSERNPCSKCGCQDIRCSVESDSQYLYCYCSGCENKSQPSWFFKGCGMEDMGEDEIANENWNRENPKA